MHEHKGLSRACSCCDIVIEYSTECSMQSACKFRLCNLLFGFLRCDRATCSSVRPNLQLRKRFFAQLFHRKQKSSVSFLSALVCVINWQQAIDGCAGHQELVSVHVTLFHLLVSLASNQDISQVSGPFFVAISNCPVTRFFWNRVSKLTLKHLFVSGHQSFHALETSRVFQLELPGRHELRQSCGVVQRFL